MLRCVKTQVLGAVGSKLLRGPNFALKCSIMMVSCAVGSKLLRGPNSALKCYKMMESWGPNVCDSYLWSNTTSLLFSATYAAASAGWPGSKEGSPDEHSEQNQSPSGIASKGGSTQDTE